MLVVRALGFGVQGSGAGRLCKKLISKIFCRMTQGKVVMTSNAITIALITWWRISSSISSV